jgi:hypothetical protein
MASGAGLGGYYRANGVEVNQIGKVRDWPTAMSVLLSREIFGLGKVDRVPKEHACGLKDDRPV